MSADPRIRVFHCDDSEPFTELVRHWLVDQPDVEHVGAAHEPDVAREALGTLAPDVVLLDTMSWGGRRLLIADVRTVAPSARVIIFSGYPQQLAERILDGAGDLYIKKSESDDGLLEAIRSVVG